jgi:MscS family membrane protein
MLRLVAIGLSLFFVVEASEYIGWAVAPVLAGLGVGGLAIALAARPTIENIIGGLTLFFDKPARVGEFCRFGERVGTIEEIGLRSTRIRSLDRTVITIPNAEFSQMAIENYNRRDVMLLRATIGLRYETTPDQLRCVLAGLREMMIRHPRVSPDPARARFLEFGASSLDIEMFAYVRTSDWNEYLAIREDLNLRIMDIIKASGTSIAFPSQTLYFRKDAGLDAELVAAAEARVKQMRADAQLPFPNFTPERVREMQDRLDYPPPGSPDHHPQAPAST